jgi:HSP20 family molecular chaperone IbpA
MTKALSSSLFGSDFGKSFLGFDYLRDFNLDTTYPRYNIIKGENESFRIDLLVPGLNKEDINVTFKSGTLTIDASKVEETETAEYKGFSTKAFKRSFTLNSAFEIAKVALDKGILSISVEKSKVEPEHVLQIE